MKKKKTLKKQSVNSIENRVYDFATQVRMLEKWYNVKLGVKGETIAIFDEFNQPVTTLDQFQVEYEDPFS